MKNPKKDKKFNDYIFENYNDSDKYDLILFVFNKIRNLLLSDKWNDFNFHLLSIEKQYNLCVLIYHIHIAAHRKIINEVSLSKKEISEHSKIYDLEFGFEEPEYIEINGIKMLSI